MSDAARRLAAIPFWPVLILGAAILIVNHSQFLPAGLMSDGDLSANELLIRDASELRLCFGPYSRFGFHHPGPVSFYYLAFAQHLFWSLPSALGSQRMAQLVLNLLLLHLVLRMIQRMTGERRDAWLYLAMIAMAVLPIGVGQHPLYDYWGPYMTIVPQVMFLLASGMMLAGELRFFPAFCVGAVISGHNHYLNAALTLAVAVIVVIGLLVFQRKELRTYFGRKSHWLWLLLVTLSLCPPLYEELTGQPGNLTRTAQVLASNTPVERTFQDIATGVFWNAGSSVVLAMPGAVEKWGLIHPKLMCLVILAWVVGVASCGLWSRRGFAPVTLIMGLAYVLCLILGYLMLDNPVQVPYVFHFTAGIAAYFNFILLRALARLIPRGGDRWRAVRAVFPGLATTVLIIVFCIRFPVHPEFSTDPNVLILSTLAETKADAVNIFLEFGQEDHALWPRFVLLVLQCEEAGYRVLANSSWAFMIGEHRTGESRDGKPMVVFSGANLPQLSSDAPLRRVTDQAWIMPSALPFETVGQAIRAARTKGD